MISLAGCLMFIGLTLMTMRPTLVLSTIGCVLVGLGTAAVVPVCYGLAGKCSEVPVATALAFVTTIGFLGFLLMPAVVGILSEWAGLKTALFLVGLCSLLLTQLILFAPRQKEKRNEDAFQ